MIEWMHRYLFQDFWVPVWPNLAAAVIWIPVAMIHVTRSNRKSLRVYFGRDEEEDQSAP